MLAEALHHLEFITSSGRPYDDGLVSVHETSSRIRRPDEEAVLRDAAAFEHVSHVFFRRFLDGRSSRPVAFVIDNSNERLSEDELARLHKKLWLHGVAPLVYIAWPTRVDVLTCARGPDFWQRGSHVYRPIEQIEIAGRVQTALDAQKRFAASRLANGTFWEDPNNAEFAKHDKAAHESLIQAIVEADEELDGENRPILRRLLLLSVLIKYLEDRRVFAATWFGRFRRGARTFFAVLREGNAHDVLRLLRTLERRFNGDVFTLPPEAEEALTSDVLDRFAQLVEARTLGNQRYLWEQYSFEHLPVEVISHLYQRFVTGHGTVYTPPHLATLILDHAMPYDELRGDERVLDPACGSGVFLVGAFRRLVHVWRSRNHWREPDVETLEHIVQTCIFGVELDPMAVDLTVFSLSLAICDALRPQVIWGELRFAPLRDHNIMERDFFDLVDPTDPDESDEAAPANELQSARQEIGTFDIIIGNPPFESELSEAGQRVDDRLAMKRGNLPDRQVAYLFLEQSLGLLAENGRLCLIQVAGFLYNRLSAQFAQRLVKTVTVSAVLDFVSMRNLFDAADTKVVAVLARQGVPGPEHSIAHLTFRRVFATHQRIGFELDHYDWHHVPQSVAETDRLIWRVNLLGGGRLVGLAERMRSMRSLGDFITEKEWISGEGFIVGRRNHEAPWLTGRRYLPTDALTSQGIDLMRLDWVEEKKFQWPREEHLFEAPLVLIKEHESLPVAFWNDGGLAYRDKIVGIHAPSNEAELAEFFQTFQSRRRQYRFCCALNGSQAMVNKATAILKSDIEALPYPEDGRELDFAFWEEVLQDDVLEYMVPYIRLGQNSELLERAVDQEQLAAYRDMFCQLLSSIYDNLTSADPIFLNGLVGQPFIFGDAPEVEWIGPESQSHLHRLVYNELLDSLRTIRVVRFYERNAMLIVKPDRLRYWIRSTAIRDADDTLADLYEQGY